MNESIEYLPTLILYNKGNQIIRIEADITLKLPEDYKKKINLQIDKQIENKF